MYKKLDLSAPSFKWLFCRKCNQIEVKVSVEAVSCVCEFCLTMQCDYVPSIPKEPKTPRKKKVVMSTFAKKELLAKEQAELAKSFENKKSKKN